MADSTFISSKIPMEILDILQNPCSYMGEPLTEKQRNELREKIELTYGDKTTDHHAVPTLGEGVAEYCLLSTGFGATVGIDTGR